MKRMVLILSFLFAFSVSALAAGPGDVLDKAKEDIESLNKFALSIHKKAAADIEDFHENLMRMDGPPKPKINELLAAGIPPCGCIHDGAHFYFKRETFKRGA